MVVLGTFDNMQSVEITACISLIIVFISIIVHLLGKPYGTHSAKVWRLHILELTALFVVWFIHWGGLMLYLCSLHGKSCDGGVEGLLTSLIVLAIVCYLGVALFVYADKIREKHGSKKKRLTGAHFSEPNGRNRSLELLDAHSGAYNGTSHGPATLKDSAEPLISVVRVAPRRDSTVLKAERVEAEHFQYERHLLTETEKRRVRSKRRTMDRVKARSKIKQSNKMKQVEIFKMLNVDGISCLVDAMEMETFEQGQTIVEEKEDSDSFYVIVEGTCVVKQNTFTSMPHGQKVGVLHELDHFGESSLIQIVEGERQVRNASVVAESPKVVVMSLSSSNLQALMEDDRIDRAAILQGVENVRRRRRAGTQRKLTGNSNSADADLIEDLAEGERESLDEVSVAANPR
eukprot:g2059.t1